MKTTGRVGENNDSAQYWDSKPNKGKTQILDSAAPTESVGHKSQNFLTRWTTNALNIYCNIYSFSYNSSSVGIEVMSY